MNKILITGPFRSMEERFLLKIFAIMVDKPALDLEIKPFENDSKYAVSPSNPFTGLHKSDISLKMNPGGGGGGKRWDQMCSDPDAGQRVKLVRLACRLNEDRTERLFRGGREIAGRSSIFRRDADHNSTASGSSHCRTSSLPKIVEHENHFDVRDLRLICLLTVFL